MIPRATVLTLAVVVEVVAVAVGVGAATATSSALGSGTPSPADWRDLSIYQIITDRFFDGDPSNNSVEGFFDPSDGARNHGGDFAGIEEKLDYIQGLGAGAIWISPVQKNAFAAYHGFHIQDFYEIAPHFGGLPDLVSLVDAAHARGMFVILDVVANHGGDLIDSGDPGWPQFTNPGTYTLRWRDPGNPAAPPFDDLAWYHNNGAIDVFDDPNQILGELFGLDDFATEDAPVRDALIEAHQWLIEQTDVDGFRVDTVKHVDLGFWQAFGPGIHSFAADSLGKTDFFLYGEVFDGSPLKNGIYTGTQGGGAFALDSVLWFPLYFTTNAVFRDGAATSLLSNVYADSTFYDPTARNRLVSFLDNHDVARFQGFGSNADHDDAKMRTALAFQLTSLGVPVVYYGTEQEFDGGGDPFNREDMFDGSWDFGPSLGDNFDPSAPLYRTIRRLNELRSALPALRRGSLVELASAPAAGFFAYRRELAGEDPVFVVLNTDTSADTLSVDPGLGAGTIYEGLTGRTVSVAAGPVDLVVGGLSAVVFTADEIPARPWVLETWPAHDRSLSTLDAEIRITFTEAMDFSTVVAATSIDPAIGWTASAAGRTIVIAPAAPLANGTTYTITVGAAATAASGETLGQPLSFRFRTSAGAGPITVPAGFAASAIEGWDFQVPISLERGSGGTLATDRLWLGDTGWDRVFLTHDRGFLEARFVDDALVRPSALAQDRAGGLFGGDLLLADSDRLRRLTVDGAEAGRVSEIAILPAFALDWGVAIDPHGEFGGLAYFGQAGSGTVYSSGPVGPTTVFSTGPAAVHGLAFPRGVATAAFGTGLHVAQSGAILRIGPSGSSSVFASSGSLNGAAALAFDPVGNLGGDLFVANPTSQSILRVSPAGAVSTFATGFASLTGPDCLAFDELGDLYALESGTTGVARLVKITPVSTGSVTTDAPLAAGATAGHLLTIAGPNPTAESVTFRFVVPAGSGAAAAGRSGVTLSIFDVTGRTVRVLASGPFPAGEHRAAWDGRDERGRDVASGVYFARLEAAGSSETRRVVLRR